MFFSWKGMNDPQVFPRFAHFLVGWLQVTNISTRFFGTLTLPTMPRCSSLRHLRFRASPNPSDAMLCTPQCKAFGSGSVVHFDFCFSLARMLFKVDWICEET